MPGSIAPQLQGQYVMCVFIQPPHERITVYTCEDYPCCGHELGDCDGSKYGSDEDIKQAVYDRYEREYCDPDYDFDYEEDLS